MYAVHVTKKGHHFAISEICCKQAAEKIKERWEELGFTAEIVRAD